MDYPIKSTDFSKDAGAHIQSERIRGYEPSLTLGLLTIRHCRTLLLLVEAVADPCGLYYKIHSTLFIRTGTINMAMLD